MRRNVSPVTFVLILSLILFCGLFSNATAAPEDYAGAYKCTFGGDITGIAIVQVDAWGSLYGLIWSEQEQAVDYVAGGATVDDSGNFSFFSYCGMWVTGAISEAGVISGTWDYQTYDGTLSGELDTGSIDPYVDNYSIYVSGDYTGTCDAQITSDGRFSGTFQINGVDGTDEVYMGMVDSAGNIIVISYDETGAKGQVTEAGEINGTWRNEDSSGTFSTQAGGSSGGGGGGGGGGGCFIASLFGR